MYKAVKKEEIMTVVERWMELEITVVTEASQNKLRKKNVTPFLVCVCVCVLEHAIKKRETMTGKE